MQLITIDMKVTVCETVSSSSTITPPTQMSWSYGQAKEWQMGPSRTNAIFFSLIRFSHSFLSSQ